MILVSYKKGFVSRTTKYKPFLYDTSVMWLFIYIHLSLFIAVILVKRSFDLYQYVDLIKDEALSTN